MFTTIKDNIDLGLLAVCATLFIASIAYGQGKAAGYEEATTGAWNIIMEGK